MKKRWNVSKTFGRPVDEMIVDINAIGSLVLWQRQSLIAVSKRNVKICISVLFERSVICLWSSSPDGGLPLHPLNQILGVLTIANTKDARTAQGDTLPQWLVSLKL